MSTIKQIPTWVFKRNENQLRDQFKPNWTSHFFLAHSISEYDIFKDQMEKTKLSIYQTKSPQETEAEMEEMHHLTLEQFVMYQTKMLHFLGLRSVLSSFFFLNNYFNATFV